VGWGATGSELPVRRITNSIRRDKLSSLLDYALDKKIIKYKTDLETEKEKQLAEYGKSITGFNKFFDKRYEVYPVMYSKVLRLHGELSNWAPSQYTPDFPRLTLEEFADYLDAFGFSKPDKRELIAKQETGDFINQDFMRLLPRHFASCLTKTNNHFLENRLFISKEVESLVEKFIKNAASSRSGYYWVFEASTKHHKKWEEIESANKENDQVVLDIFNQMRSELEHGVQDKGYANNLEVEGQ